MKYKAQIVPTENGWTVTQIQSPGVIQPWEATSGCAGKDWSFETLDSLLRALPEILDPTEQPKDFKCALEKVTKQPIGGGSFPLQPRD